jgi:hypothetical protein
MKIQTPVAIPAKPPQVSLAAAVPPVARILDDVETRIGVRPKEVPADLNAIRAALLRGVLIDTFIRRWRGNVRLTLRDAGLSQDGDSKEMFCLIPPKVLSEIVSAENSIRRSARDYGFKVIGQRGFFVELTSFHAFRRAFDQGKGRLQQIYSNLADNATKHLEAVKTSLDKLVERAWLGHRDVWVEGGKSAGDFAGRVAPTKDFREDFYLRFTRMIPPPDVIRTSIEVEYSVDLLHLPEVVAAVHLASDNEELNRELRRAMEEQRDSLPRRFSDSVVASVNATLLELRARAMKAQGSTPGGITKLFNASLVGLQGAREMNIISHPQVETVIKTAISELKRAKALCDGRQQALQVADILPPLIKASAEVARLAYMDEE